MKRTNLTARRATSGRQFLDLWKDWRFGLRTPDILILRGLNILSVAVTAKPSYAGQPEFSEQTIEKDMGTF